jgi:hypothetical protein
VSRYLNGRRRWRVVTPGMRIWTEDEEELVAVAPLRPPLRWAVSVGYCYTVEVSACAPPRPAAVDADAAAAAARAIDEKQELLGVARSLRGVIGQRGVAYPGMCLNRSTAPQ